MRPSDHPRRPAAGLAALVGALALALGPAAAVPASAAPPRTVDPATVQPTLNPDYAPWTCFETGQGITCQGENEDSYSFPLDGFTCDGRQVWLSGTVHERMTRWHTADGLATKTLINLAFPRDVFSFDPAEDGPELVVSGHFNQHYTYEVAGDLGSRVLTERGLVYLARSGGRPLLRDVGSVQFEPGRDHEAVAVAHGVHEFYDDPALLDTLVCETLTA